MIQRALVSSFVVGLIAACVGNDADLDPPTSGDAGGGGGDGGGNGEGGGGGNDSGVDTGTPPPNRSIICDITGTCSGVDLCCAGGTDNTDWDFATCKPDCGAAYTLECDDPDDCGPGLKCCYSTDGGARIRRSSCNADCASFTGELCTRGTHCPLSGVCVPFMNFGPSNVNHCAAP